MKTVILHCNGSWNYTVISQLDSSGIWVFRWGPFIKYVTLEGGPRMCEFVTGGGGQEHVMSRLYKFLSYIWTWNLKWCLTFCC